ncbi:MAG: transcription-repair coupling factor [Candidatus Omnitrophica bacterium]|nr:transcription-repair coupling factor [Candidatus Omnitrophota bacterium]
MANWSEIEPFYQLPWLGRAAQVGVSKVGTALGAARSLVVARAARDHHGPIMAVVPDQPAMENLVDELEFLGATSSDDYWESLKKGEPLEDRPLPPVFPFPHLETLPYENKSPESHLKSDRLRVFEILGSLLEGDHSHLPGGKCLIVLPVRSLMARVPDLVHLKGAQRILRPGGELDRDEFSRSLMDEGYEATEFISDTGQFSVRGGILDIFPFTASEPIRIELFGDEIDSIRTFDILTQRSKQKLENLVVGSTDEIRQLVSTWRRNGDIHSLADFLPDETRVFWDRPELVEEESSRVHSLVEKMFSQRSYFEEEGEIEEENPLLEIPPDSLYAEYSRLREEVSKFPSVDLSEFSGENEADREFFDLPVSTPNLAGLDFKMKIQDVVDRARKGERFLLVADNEGQKERLQDLILDLTSNESSGLDAESMRGAALRAENRASEYTQGPARRKRAKKPEFKVDNIAVVIGGVRQGFHCLETNLTLVTDQEIFGRLRKIRTRRKAGVGMPIVDLVDLQPGNFIVHIDHGIGRFVGLKRMTVGGREGEFLELRYADEDVIYVPIEQIDRVTRYVGSEEAPPKLSKVGGKAWQAAKSRAKKAIEDLSGQLLNLYARRQVREGYAFPADTPWQHEFEAAFPYDETPDQWKAIQDVKQDMESPHSMDRLVCGDVGFGKTEVAMRAAFKAVCEGKQVAVLAPTTVLVQQHFETFADRMEDYPVVIDCLNRFRSQKDTKVALKNLTEGEIDIVVGTHRLLQKDIAFKDLGLVIVDEEQRFGVKHKEKFKHLRSKVDVLTLTATPIPRTLYMSMSGVRDMSLVNTPPKDRLPVETYVMEYKPEVVESAVLRELARGGQVFFLHNRVESIYGMASMVQEVVPEARVAVGHGQMEGHELEKVMHRFIDGEVDVLVSTTIIESGLDIPNANTILINRADTFGLSELYQLRGRVGRAHHQAYCYLMVPSKKGLTPVARQRLLALQEHKALGSGFHIAMRDLEIRGMGNILGREQHGHIAAIGFDLYSSLLAKEIQRMRGEILDEEIETALDTYRPGEFPPDYIPSARQRMSIHKRMASIDTEDQRKKLREEIEDLYGKLPAKAELVFINLLLKEKARKGRIDHIRIRPEGAKLRLNEKATQEFSPELVVKLDQAYPGRIKLSVKSRIYLEVSPPKKEEKWEETLIEILGALQPEGSQAVVTK